MSHTPGPWNYHLHVPKGSGDGYWRVDGPRDDDTDVVALIDPDEIADNAEANARLIAAAPDLLAALRDLQREMWRGVKLNVKKHAHLLIADACANTAIHKATGGAR